MKRLTAGPWHGLRSFALTTGAAAFLLAALVLVLGWGLGVAAVRRPLADFATMKPNAALGIGTLGLALILSQLGGPIRCLHSICGALVALLAAITLAEYAFGWNAGIDQLLFIDPATPAAGFPGRPAPLTATLLLMLSMGMSAAERRGWRHLKTGSALLALLITWTLLNAYLFASSTPHGVLPFGTVAVHTAGALFLIALGVLAAQPTSWPVRTVFAHNMGGTVCRWLLPAAIVAPPVLGWMVRDPNVLGEPRAAFNWALYSVISSVGSVALILVLAHRIELLDAERTAATLKSRHDELTDLANRRAFDAFLVEAFSRAWRYQWPLSLLTIDVDEFKSYNDTFGHPAGDEVLIAMARVFAAVARDTDLAARIGGEEFALVLPDTPESGALALAERIRHQVTEIALRRPITVSIGVATLSSMTPTAAALLAQSDAALYAAKRGGCNRIVTSATRAAWQVREMQS